MSNNIDRMREAAAQAKQMKHGLPPAPRATTKPAVAPAPAAVPTAPPASEPKPKKPRRHPQHPRERDVEMSKFRLPTGTSLVLTYTSGVGVAGMWTGVLTVPKKADATSTTHTQFRGEAPGVHQLVSELGRRWYADQEKPTEEKPAEEAK